MDFDNFITFPTFVETYCALHNIKFYKIAQSPLNHHLG